MWVNRIWKANVSHSSDTERFFLKDAIMRNNKRLRTQRKTKAKHDQLVMILRSKRFGTALSDGKKHFQNLSKYVLLDTESSCLDNGHGLNFCLPPKTVCQEQMFAEFELL